ncbi:protein Son isoform X2 [Aricia agestis]|uniref:protein Son isoform X2 n=1 Tax=Aricia agestis TaxID=91739 RepID=UPI001C2015CD|nr:protein Son isoform X2 [Aricia agestis]
MTSLIEKIEKLIKREKTTPERKKDETSKSSSEILSELFSAFNAAPPKIEDISSKKSKKSKKKVKKEKKKRSRDSSSSDSDSDYSHKRKKRKKTKSKKSKKGDRSRSPSNSRTPPRIKAELLDKKLKKESVSVKEEKVKSERHFIVKAEPKLDTCVKVEKIKLPEDGIDTSLIPMPESPKDLSNDSKSDKKDQAENDKLKGKIQIKNLKFSAVFEETVKKAEEEARKKAEKTEEGECTDSSSSSSKDEESNSQFPKSADPGGILKKAADQIKIVEDGKNSKTKSSDKSKSSNREHSRSRRRSRSPSKTTSSRKQRHRSRSRSKRRSRSRHRSSSRSKRRSISRSRHRTSRHISPVRHRSRRSRSPTGVRLADSEKKRLLEVARRNAINMLKNGAVPAGAAALPPHTRNQVMAAIQSGGKSVDELTDFCKHLSKKEALGELSSVSSNDGDMSENEDTIAFHHPFLVKEKAPIVMNIRGGAPLPIKSTLPVANKEELRIQFPVSSGTQHRDSASEWVPVSPKKDNMQVAKLNSKPSKSTAITPSVTTTTACSEPLALPAPPTVAIPLKSFTSGSQLNTVPAIAAPGPQAYPPGKEPAKIDLASIVSQKLSMIRKEQEQNELTTNTLGFGWSSGALPAPTTSKGLSSKRLGQFTGSTDAQLLTPRELAGGAHAWAKKLQACWARSLYRLRVTTRSELIIQSIIPSDHYCVMVMTTLL